MSETLFRIEWRGPNYGDVYGVYSGSGRALPQSHNSPQIFHNGTDFLARPEVSHWFREDFFADEAFYQLLHWTWDLPSAPGSSSPHGQVVHGWSLWLAVMPRDAMDPHLLRCEDQNQVVYAFRHEHADLSTPQWQYATSQVKHYRLYHQETGMEHKSFRSLEIICRQIVCCKRLATLPQPTLNKSSTNWTTPPVSK